MRNDLAVERFRQVQRIRRAYFAADSRRDYQKTEMLGQQWTLAAAMEAATPPASDEGARVKLGRAVYYADISAGAVGGVDDALEPELAHIARATATARNRIALKDLVALRAMLPRAAVDPRVYAPLSFAIDWWSRPRIVE
jgi:hypothetical protein